MGFMGRRDMEYCDNYLTTICTMRTATAAPRYCVMTVQRISALRAILVNCEKLRIIDPRGEFSYTFRHASQFEPDQ